MDAENNIEHAMSPSAPVCSTPAFVAGVLSALAPIGQLDDLGLLRFGHRSPAGDLGARATAADAHVVAVEFANFLRTDCRSSGQLDGFR